MTQFAVILFWILMVSVALQLLLALGFFYVLFRWRRKLPADDDCPKVALVVCLRGPDPFLEKCLTALVNLDYPNYDVRIVVDHEDDPARPIAEGVRKRDPTERIQIDILSERRENCSLKCSSVVQAVRQLDESYDVVALADGDTVPHASWLRELVAPLADERVGAATGNRWYMPEATSTAAMVRYLWNAAAVVQMYWMRIPWGGTLAIKTKVVRDAGLLDRWSQAFCEDTMLAKVLRDEGLRIAFVPSLIMVNREDCELAGLFRWVRRQLLTVRLYHPSWLAVVPHGLVTSFGPPLALLGLLVAVVFGQWQAAVWLALGTLIYQGVLLATLPPVEWLIRRLVLARGEQTTWVTPAKAILGLVAMPVTQVFYAAVLVSTMLLRATDWRGVTYTIDGPWKIRLVEYRPYEQQEAVEKRQHSL